MTWSRTSLGEVAVSVRNGLFARRPTDEAAGTRILRISAVRDGKVDLEQSRFVEGIEPKQLQQFSIESGDLLITRYNGSRALVGTSGIVPPHAGPVIHPDKLIRVVLDASKADPRFVNYQLQSPSVRAFLEPRIRTTAGQSGISGKDVRSIPLVIPDLREQRRIVELLEDHISRLDAADYYLDANVRRIERWRAAASQRELSRGRPAMRPVGELLREPMRNGRSDRAARAGESGTRALTLTAVTRKRFDDKYTKLTVTPADVAESLWLEPGDILVQRANTPELVGTAARYDGPSGWAIFPDLLIRLRAKESVVDSRFLVAALRSEPVHKSLRARAKGLAGSMPKIDQRSIAETEVPVPDRDRQLEAITRLERIESAAEEASAEFERQRKRAAALRRSLLSAAFAGHLIS